MGFEERAVVGQTEGREPNLEGTSPSPIPVAASPSGQLRIVDDSGGRIHPDPAPGDKAGEMDMWGTAERPGSAGVSAGSGEAN